MWLSPACRDTSADTGRQAKVKHNMAWDRKWPEMHPAEEQTAALHPSNRCIVVSFRISSLCHFDKTQKTSGNSEQHLASKEDDQLAVAKILQSVGKGNT